MTSTNLCLYQRYDSGKHYLNLKVVGAMQTLIPEVHKISTRINFGPGAHFKGICDGFFCVLNSGVDAATKTQWIGDIADLHKVMEALAQNILILKVLK